MQSRFVSCSLLIFSFFSLQQVFSAPCVHQILNDIEREKNLIGDIAEARAALRDYRLSLTQLGKQVATSVMSVTEQTFLQVKEMVEKLKEQGLTVEEEAQLQELIKQTKVNINEIVKGNLQDLKGIRMAAAEILDDLIYDHSQIPADVEKLTAAIKQFQMNAVTSTKQIGAELKKVQDLLSTIMTTHANEMSVTISETLENIRLSLRAEYQKFKDELVQVKQAEAKAVEAIKKVLSHFDPAAHVTQMAATTVKVF